MLVRLASRMFVAGILGSGSAALAAELMPDKRGSAPPLLVEMDVDAPNCGDFNEDGAISATDALGALNFSVGIGDCPVCVCDVDSSGSTTATDALRILRGAVGLPEVFDCPPDAVPLAWDGGGDGVSWSDGPNWETNIPPTGCEAVTIADTGGLVVLYDNAAGDSTVHSIVSDAGFSMTGGELRVRKTMEFTDSMTLDGGSLVDATVTAASAGAIGIYFPGSSLAHLIATTIEAGITLPDSSSRFFVEQGITLNGTVTLSGNSARISFEGITPQVLDGTGEIVMDPASIGLDVVGDATLTIEEEIRIRGSGARVGESGVLVNRATIEVDADGDLDVNCSGGENEGTLIATAGRLVFDGGLGGCTNSGTITATDGADILMEGVWLNEGGVAISGGGTLDLEGTWSNAGTIDATDSIVNLGGEFRTEDVGTLSRPDSTVNLTGTMDNAGGFTLDASTGEWVLAQGEIVGGVVNVNAGGALAGAAGQSDLVGVTINGPIELRQNAVLRCIDGLTLNGTATLGPNSALRFDGGGEQIFDGDAEVFFDTISTNPRVDVEAGTTLRIASTVIIHGTKGNVGDPAGGLINEGTIEADGGGRIDITGIGWTNEGTILAQTSGDLRWSGNGTNNGVVRLAPGSEVDAIDGFTQGAEGRLVIEIDGPGSNGRVNAVNDLVTLDGALEPALLGGYEADVGDTFEVVRFASITGSFATLDGADFAVDKAFVVTTDAVSLNLEAVSAGP
jgi:hypothetical protein